MKRIIFVLMASMALCSMTLAQNKTIPAKKQRRKKPKSQLLKMTILLMKKTQMQLPQLSIRTLPIPLQTMQQCLLMMIFLFKQMEKAGKQLY